MAHISSGRKKVLLNLNSLLLLSPFQLQFRPSISDEPAPVIACSNVRYLEWLSATRGGGRGGGGSRVGGVGEVSWRSLGLWSEVECTTEFVDRMR